MGILHEKEDATPLRIEDVAENEQVIDYGDYVFDDELIEEREEEEELELALPPRYVPRRRRVWENVVRQKDASCPTDGLNVKKNMGARKWRRVESARMLMNFADPQDILYDGSDLVDETISAFARLLSNEDSMKRWNEFIEKDEEEQNRILEEIDNASRKHERESVNKEEKLRAHHPAFSAKTCFERMDKKFRSNLLRSRNLPLEFIERTEEQLRGFFSTNSGGVYVEALPSRMKRFYVHAISQFLALKSATLTSPDKVVQITNANPKFTPPDTSLVPFVMKRRRLKQSAAFFDEFELVF